MGDWRITLVNRTGDGGLPSVPVAVMMFQTDITLEVNSWSSAWKIAEVGYPGNVGPIKLPTKVQFYIKDLSFGNLRTTGPFDVEFGQAISVIQESADDAPHAQVSTNETAPAGQIKVNNESNNAQRLEMALYKDGRPLVSFKNVNPGNSAYLSVEPALYLADANRSSFTEGDDFQAVVQAQSSTKFKLFPAKRNIIINILQRENRQIVFEENP